MVRKLEWETKASSKPALSIVPTTSTSSSNAKQISSSESPLAESKEVYEFSFDEFEDFEFESIAEKEILDHKTRAVFISLISQCIQDLLILSNVCKPFVGEMGPANLNHRSLDDRYGYDVGENYDDYRIDMPYTNLHKVQKDIKTIVKILDDAISELDSGGSYSILENHALKLELMLDDENKLLKKLVHKKEKYRKLKKSMRKEKYTLMNKTIKMRQNLQDIMTLVQDEIETRKTEISFTNNWEIARKEQNSIILKNKEEGYSVVFHEMTKQTDLEQFCHKNIEEFILETQNDYQEEIFYWMNHYDEEIDKRDLEIINMRQKAEKIADDLGKLKELYEQRCNEMEEWIKYKEEKAERDRLLEIQIRAATKIQAWWRGVMVRRKLGPYRRRKGKKNKKGKNKGKGKAPAKKKK